ncbi:hypothetical protein L1987_53489 [Smallanthus sonchifolius]|uniref:Uncharacterized protein n=1 Tax=Smallanthus sonchifolius TaxID=185202 RepID=A0ACB9EWG4_9ASTR|nr:hypothetical protein L1987_53489 [Smallanthus sonchifolius]
MRPPLNNSPLSGVQKLFDLNMSGHVNEDEQTFDDVEADEVVQVTDLLLEEKPRGHINEDEQTFDDVEADEVVQVTDLLLEENPRG